MEEKTLTIVVQLHTEEDGERDFNGEFYIPKMTETEFNLFKSWLVFEILKIRSMKE